MPSCSFTLESGTSLRDDMLKHVLCTMSTNRGTTTPSLANTLSLVMVNHSHSVLSEYDATSLIVILDLNTVAMLPAPSPYFLSSSAPAVRLTHHCRDAKLVRLGSCRKCCRRQACAHTFSPINDILTTSRPDSASYYRHQHDIY
jgi:hypothetical protein